LRGAFFLAASPLESRRFPRSNGAEIALGALWKILWKSCRAIGTKSPVFPLAKDRRLCYILEAHYFLAETHANKVMRAEIASPTPTLPRRRAFHNSP
jgi:hypothetical protein